MLVICFVGLFERHKLLFSFQMTIKIMEADNKLNPEELDFFLKGNISLEKSSRSKPFPWLPDQGWEDIQRLMAVTPEAFSSLSDDIERNGSEWKEVQRLKQKHNSYSVAIILLGVFWQNFIRIVLPSLNLCWDSVSATGLQAAKQWKASGGWER